MDGEGSHELTVTESALLGMLARYGESSGYSLRKQAEEGIGFFWSPSKSQIYEVLPRLASRGLTTGRIQEQPDKPDRHLWRITPRGQGALRRWLSTPEPDPLNRLNVMMLKLFFGDYGEPTELVRMIERLRDQLSARLAALRDIDAEATFTDPAELPRLTLALGIAEVSAHLQWAETTLPRLQSRVSALHSGRTIGSDASTQPKEQR